MSTHDVPRASYLSLEDRGRIQIPHTAAMGRAKGEGRENTARG